MADIPGHTWRPGTAVGTVEHVGLVMVSILMCDTGAASPSQTERGSPKPARARLPARGGPRMAAKSRYGAVGMAQVAHKLQTARHQLKPAPVPRGVTTAGPHAAIAALQSKV